MLNFNLNSATFGFIILGNRSYITVLAGIDAKLVTRIYGSTP